MISEYGGRLQTKRRPAAHISLGLSASLDLCKVCLGVTILVLIGQLKDETV